MGVKLRDSTHMSDDGRCGGSEEEARTELITPASSSGAPLVATDCVTVPSAHIFFRRSTPDSSQDKRFHCIDLTAS